MLLQRLMHCLHTTGFLGLLIARMTVVRPWRLARCKWLKQGLSEGLSDDLEYLSLTNTLVIDTHPHEYFCEDLNGCYRIKPQTNIPVKAPAILLSEHSNESLNE